MDLISGGFSGGFSGFGGSSGEFSGLNFLFRGLSGFSW